MKGLGVAEMGPRVEVGEETRTEKGVGPGNGAGGRESLAATISHVEFLTMGHENPYFFFFPSQHGHLVLSTLCESARVWSCRLEQAPLASSYHIPCFSALLENVGNEALGGLASPLGLGRQLHCW